MNTENEIGPHIIDAHREIADPSTLPGARFSSKPTEPAPRRRKTSSSQPSLESQGNSADDTIQATDQPTHEALSPSVGRKKRSRASTSAKPGSAVLAENGSGGGDQIEQDSQSRSESPDPIHSLINLQRHRIATVRSQRRIDQQAESLLCRYVTGDVPLKEKYARSAKAVAAIEKGGEVPPEFTEAIPFVTNCLLSRSGFDDYRKSVEKSMTALAKTLPLQDFVENTRGFGHMSLAIIVAEAGDIGTYGNPAKLWKRMGLAPDYCYKMETKSGKEAIAKPRQRRSAMFTVGDALLKNNDGKYRKIYDERKAYEVARNPEMTKMHAHRRAQRVMEKALLKDIWIAWPRATKNF